MTYLKEMLDRTLGQWLDFTGIAPEDSREKALPFRFSGTGEFCFVWLTFAALLLVGLRFTQKYLIDMPL